ncbi:MULTISPECIES: ABC transporter permease [Arthrobacter]|uniref:ABC transporter permease n=1 Tax=Arthrobacter psychrochitiniphilus TaxID=291045 RepID=A0A2V3DWS4_9MICC|nr:MULTISPECIES: ABC transporter permease [Arthrobacter]NYG16351.1 peptide/nickel transport system permease protein [Arthrobacter psychrochitiniphilus]PXA69487.1 ABC transporter permease [Arthrobacter psychrochitiniphilus]
MISYIFRRIGSGIALVAAASFIVFALMLANSEHVARNILGDQASVEQLAAKQAELGLNDPMILQYLHWLLGAVQGDLGQSWFNAESVSYLLATRVPVTLSIAVGTVIISTVISVVVGIVAALYRGWLDKLLQVVSVAGLVFPGFWLALVLVVKVSIDWGLVPATGYTPFGESLSGWLLSLTLPVFSLAIGAVAGLSQQVRSATIAVLEMDYVRTLRSRGLSEASVLFRHVLRNAAPPTLTVMSLNFIALMSGAVMIERVFALPGLGSIAVDATGVGDIPIVVGAVVISVVIVVIVNLLIDLINGWLNPKVRLS